MTIKAIPTRYAGRRFRSRLEARFAVFFDALRLDWHYEPQGFALPSGWYLPDFYLPKLDGGTWIEVKPWGAGSYFGWGEGPRLEDARLDEFAKFINQTTEDPEGTISCEKTKGFFVAHGLPDPRLGLAWDQGSRFRGYDEPGLLAAPWDPHYWCVCGCGKTIGIEFDGRGDRIQCQHKGCAKSSHGDKGYSADHERIYLAAVAAHSADFA
jgi:hypothetical protein